MYLKTIGMSKKNTAYSPRMDFWGVYDDYLDTDCIELKELLPELFDLQWEVILEGFIPSPASIPLHLLEELRIAFNEVHDAQF